MNRIKIPYISIFLASMVCALTVLFPSCIKEDDYKKFTEGGEISYTGKLDSIKIFSGRNRVVIQGLLIADPKVTRCVIYWNNRADSVTIPVTRTENIDTLKVELKNMIEGVHNFTIYTYDNLGNQSVPTYKSGRAYGDRYVSSLSNRPINNAYTDEAGLTSIEWGVMDRLSGIFATDVTYTNASDQQQVLRIPVDSSLTYLDNFKEKTDIRFRTMFIPDSMSIDTFYTTVTTKYIPKFSQADITGTYLKNAGPNVNYSSIAGNNRWGILSDWTSNAAIKNASGFGGYERRSTIGFISLEAGWGLPNVTDGKIFQTVTLPAGSYRFSVVMNEFNSGGSRYLSVAVGNDLPNASDVTGSSIAFSNLESKVLNFTLTAPTTVSIGFVCSLTGTSGTGMYSKIASVKLYSIQYL
ncbi:DUF4998 domain-containing protein [Niabella yanshanensis]|uniref:DUF4998 domain-containing protein n=1 Tax=Niabella yanshanensis TaxID=577386 RepID=A0ABZ0W5Q4_9BACT|nr:DUF4998 domain-containing protein [Niabella yanshanensis]WQD36857.1 DUF4998 domain-containing protein [Niabella yanshanensis]